VSLDCTVHGDGAQIICAADGVTLLATTNEHRVGWMPNSLQIAQVIVSAHAEPNRMIEYLPGIKAGVFRVTWRPRMLVAGLEAETAVALISIRDARNGRFVMCTVGAHEWLDLYDWARSITDLDPTPVIEGLGLVVLHALMSRGAGNTGVRASSIFCDVRASSREILLELCVLAHQGMVQAWTRTGEAVASSDIADYGRCTFRVTRLGAEALLQTGDH
jgi:hypothetical protein